MGLLILNGKTVLMSTTLMFLSLIFAAPALAPSVHAAVGTVCVRKIVFPNCPVSADHLGNGAINSQIQAAVNIDGSDPLNGFDVLVVTDPNFLSPVSVDLTGNVLSSIGPTFTLISCVNGIGAGCTALDGPGLVHVAVVGLGFTTLPSTTGLLFTITYTIVAHPTGGNFVTAGFQTGCAGTSVSNTCVTIANATGLVVPETVLTALFP